MATAYNGRSGNELRASPITNITGASNTTPIRITTGVPHGLMQGDLVSVYGITGNTAANGNWYVSVFSATQFDLYADWSGNAVALPVAGNGVYTGGTFRTVLPATWKNASTLPDDGDAMNAASVNTPLEGNFDRESWLIARSGTANLWGMDYISVGANAPGVPWVVLNAPNATWGAAYDMTTPYYGSGSTIHVPAGHIVEASFSGSFINAANTNVIRLRIDLFDYGTVVAAQTIYGTSIETPAGIIKVPIYLHAWGVNGSRSQFATVSLEAGGILGADTETGYGEASLLWRIWRPSF